MDHSLHVASVLKDWIPYRLKETDGTMHCEWLYLGDTLFTRPFFDETIAQCRSLSENSKLRRSASSTSMLHEWATAADTIAPTAIIFHVSRCGSTLLSQLLATNTADIVLSEVPFFDELLRMGYRNGNTETVLPLLDDAIKLYGKKRRPDQEHLFIKADSWHIHFYDELRNMYPGTPVLLLYRRPDEVIRSQQKQRGMHAIPGMIEPGLFGFPEEAAFSTDLDAYMAGVLETYYAAFTAILKKDPLAFAFDYKEGMMNIVQQMLEKCGIALSAAQSAAMLDRSSRHSKYPGQAFSEEAVNKTPPAYMERAFQLYNELDEYRLTHRPTS